MSLVLSNTQSVGGVILYGIGTDNIPDTISGQTIPNVDPDTYIEFEPIQITGIDATTQFSIANGEYRISTDGVTFGSYAATARNVLNEYWIQVRVLSSADLRGEEVATLSSGPISADFTAITTHNTSKGCESLTLTFENGQIKGYSRSVLDHSVECIVSGEDVNGNEMILAGSDDGYVYQLEKGTSFDGEPYESFFRLAFNHLGSPRHKKKFKKAIFGIEANSNVSLLVKPEFNYGDSATAGHRVIDIDILGGGGVWDVSNWNEFVWSSQVLTEGYADISGIGRSLSFVVYSKSDEDEPHTIYDATLHYSMRGLYK